MTLAGEQSSVARIMYQVLAALVPATAALAWYFGPAVLVQIAIASAAALASEAVMLKLRRVPLAPFLSDGSALVTAWLVGVAFPPLAPWWLTFAATAFAIVFAKQLYGGLGNNLFNPAMVAYAVAIVSFPLQMTQWSAPSGLAPVEPGFADQLGFIFAGGVPGIGIDAVTMATPLDTLKTQLHMDHSMAEALRLPIFGAVGGEVVALAYLIGGLYLWRIRVISWHIPAAFLASIALLAGALHLVDPARYASPWLHLAGGASMIGAFFILTDPVSSPTTPRGKLIYAGGAGVLTYVIRVFGGYPDGVAFATLLMNVASPLIEVYTQRRVFGKQDKGNA